MASTLPSNSNTKRRRLTIGVFVAIGLVIVLVAVTQLGQPLQNLRPSSIISGGANNVVTITTTPRTARRNLQRNNNDELPVTAFQKWTNPFPCYSSHIGLIFIKVKKCASSTTRTIVERLAYRHQEEPANKNNVNSLKDPTDHSCLEHSTHSPASILHYIPHRQQRKSYLFSMIREPTSRYISHFYFERVSENGIVDNLENFKDFTRSDPKLGRQSQLKGHEDAFKLMGGYQLSYLTISKDDLYPALPLGYYWDMNDPTVVHNPEKLVKQVSKILKQYNFIGVVERFDESLVVLSFLLNLSLGDILYAKAQKHAGSYEMLHTKDRSTQCIKLIDKNVSEEWQTFLQSDEWKAQIAGDELLYAAVSKSLDKTIDEVIGRRLFEKRLKEFEKLMEYTSVRRGCGDEKYLECSNTGKRQPVPCHNQDNHLDCQFECLDQAWNGFLKHSKPNILE